ATIERQYYNKNIEISKQTRFNTMHICYDWAQNVLIPYSPWQPGGLFFKSPFNVHLFGITNTSLEPTTQ
ncbi:5439_t:CDS:1, partial [Ambispora leptoticha]